MSLASTLIKVAIGVAVAKGVSTLAKGASGGGASNPGTGSRMDTTGGLDDIMKGIGGGAQPRQAPQGGGLGDLLGQLTGQSSGQQSPRPTRQNAPKGGLEDLLGSLGGGGQAQGGGFGDLLGQLTGGGSASQTAPQQGGGLGDLLGQLTGGGAGSQQASQQGGGLGDLLGQLTGASTGGGGQAPQQGGGLGDLLGQLTGGGAAAGGLGGLLGAMLGGGNAGSASAPAPSTRQDDLSAALILRAMIQAAKADGELDQDERAKLMQHAEGASQQEIAFINAEMAHTTTPETLASQVPHGMEAQVYMMSLLAINLDNQKEAQYLDALAKSLSLDESDVNSLHDRAGAPHLYR